MEQGNSTPEITEADRKAIDAYLYKIDIDDFDTVYCKMAAEWGILHARAEAEARPGMIAALDQYQKENGAQTERIKELEQIHDLETEENIRLVELIDDLKDRLHEQDKEVKRLKWRLSITVQQQLLEAQDKQMSEMKNEIERHHLLEFELHAKLKHNAEGWQNAVAEKDKYKDRVKELEAEVAKYAVAQKGNLSKLDELNETIALVWKALGITRCTGKHISEHVTALRDYASTLQKENEGWDQQAQEVERLKAEVAELKNGFTDLYLDNKINGYKSEVMFRSHLIIAKYKDSALQSPSSAKDTPDIDTRFGPMPQDVENKLTDYIMNIGFQLENRKHIRHGARWCYAQLKPSPVPVDINRELAGICEELLGSLEASNGVLDMMSYKPSTIDDDLIARAKAALSKASPPKQNEK